jgi:hypothetical protein
MKTTSNIQGLFTGTSYLLFIGNSGSLRNICIKVDDIIYLHLEVFDSQASKGASHPLLDKSSPQREAGCCTSSTQSRRCDKGCYWQHVRLLTGI